MATVLPSTDHSLLQPTTEPNSETKVTGEDASYSDSYMYVNATEQHEYIMYCVFIVHLSIVDANAPEYHKLDRGKERSKVKTSAPCPQQKRGGPEDYSLSDI